MAVRIVTDSTASIPAELCRELGIEVVPVLIHFGSQTLVDGIDTTEFYQRLVASPQSPTTSTPSPGAFLETYRRLAADGVEIVSIHVMSTKSAVYSTAQMAAEMEPGCPVHVVDSETLTLGLGLLVVAAARAAKAGATATEVLALVRRLIPVVSIHVAIRELTQLRKSGRVSLSQSLIAGVLGIKPLLRVDNGAIDVVDKVRSWPRAVERVLEMAHDRVKGARVAIALVHTSAAEDANELVAKVKERFNWVEVLVAEAGSALAAHAGPGAIGIVTMKLD